MRAVLTSIAVVFAIVLGPQPLAAQEAAQPPPEDGAATAALQESLDAEARALYEAGAVAYRDGRFEAAENHFRGAYDASQRPELLYNLALSAEQARHDRAALEAYELFVELLPDSPQAFRARTRIDALREILESAPEGNEDEPVEPPDDVVDESTESETTVPREDSGSGSGGDPGPGILIGVSAAVAVGGAVLLGVGLADVASVEGAERPSVWSEFSDAYDRAPILTAVGIASLAVGLAGVTVGIILAAAGGGDDDASARLRVGPGSLQLEGTF